MCRPPQPSELVADAARDAAAPATAAKDAATTVSYTHLTLPTKA